MSDEELLESQVKYNHETAEQENERRSYRDGWHQAVVTVAQKKLSKEKVEDGLPGIRYKMFALAVKPVRDPNDITTVVGPGLKPHICLPFRDPNWEELDYEIDTSDGEIHVQKYLDRNMTIFDEGTRDALAALFPEEVPAKPSRIGDGPYQYQGVDIEQSQYKDCNKESRAKSGEKAEELWNNGPEAMVDKVVYILIAPQKKKPEYKEIRAWSATPPINRKTGEELPVLHGEMGEASESAGEGESEEAPKAAAPVKKAAPAAARAPKAVVTAASKKTNGKVAAKGARR